MSCPVLLKNRRILWGDSMKIVDLGCGDRKFPGSIGIDALVENKPDIIHDLNEFPYPLESGSCDMVVTREVLEHLKYPEKFMIEIKRILSDNGILFISTNNRKSLVNRLFRTYEFKGHDSLQNIDSLTKLITKELKIIDFSLLPYNNQARTDFKYRFCRVFRSFFHRILPDSLRERMVVFAIKKNNFLECEQRYKL
jgi:SAM-dependent methyltransferase